MKNVSNFLTRALVVGGLAALAFQVPALADVGRFTVTTSVDNPNPSTHDQVNVTITVDNPVGTNTDATQLVVSFSPPKGLQIKSLPDICSLSHLGQGDRAVNCDVGLLPLGSSITLTVTVTATQAGHYSFFVDALDPGFFSDPTPVILIFQ